MKIDTGEFSELLTAYRNSTTDFSEKRAEFVKYVARQVQAAREQAIEEAADALDRMNESSGDAAAYDQRAMYMSELDREHAISDCAKAIRALKAAPQAASTEQEKKQ